MSSSRRPSSRRPSTRRRAGRPVATGIGTPATTSVADEVVRPVAASGSRITVQALMVAALALLLLMSYAATWWAWRGQRQEIQTLEQRIAITQTEIAELEDIERRWSDPAYVRQQARERFGWVMPGEVGYRVIGLDGRVQGEGAQLDDPPAPPSQNWLGRMWVSIEQSGQIEEPEETAEKPDPILKSKKPK